MNERLASFVFRTRGLYMFLSFVIAIVLKYQSRGITPPNLFLAGLIVAIAVQGVRMYAASFLWGRQAVVEVGADFLCTSGPFAYTRNPLYLGNLVIGLGVCAAINEWYAYLLFVISWILVYIIVIPYEERFLKERFGQVYTDYKARVPRLIPTLKPYENVTKVTPNYRAGILGEIHVPIFLVVIFAIIYTLFVKFV